MERYLIKSTIPGTRFIKGCIILVYSSCVIDQYVVDLLGDNLELISNGKKERWHRPYGYIGVDPIAERRKWAKYHKAKKSKGSSNLKLNL
jgi:hypothetical protein